jgi:hypothetical protein
MAEATRTLTKSTAKIHRDLKSISDAVGNLLVDAFHHLALFALGATTVWSAVAAFSDMVRRGHAGLTDILFCSSISNSARWSASISRRRGCLYAICCTSRLPPSRAY